MPHLAWDGYYRRNPSAPWRLYCQMSTEDGCRFMLDARLSRQPPWDGPASGVVLPTGEGPLLRPLPPRGRKEGSP